MMCDLRFASERATFTTAFANRGLIAEHGVSWILPRLIGPSRALDILWSGRKFDAAEADRLGILNRLLPHDDLLAESTRYIEELAAKSSPTSLMIMKQQVYKHLMTSLGPALEETNTLMAESLRRQDFKEGVASFLEKRPPKFERVTPLAACDASAGYGPPRRGNRRARRAFYARGPTNGPEEATSHEAREPRIWRSPAPPRCCSRRPIVAQDDEPREGGAHLREEDRDRRRPRERRRLPFFEHMIADKYNDVDCHGGERQEDLHRPDRPDAPAGIRRAPSSASSSPRPRPSCASTWAVRATPACWCRASKRRARPPRRASRSATSSPRSTARPSSRRATCATRSRRARRAPR